MTYLPPELRKPVGKLSAQELWDELLEDACRLEATPLLRFSPAIARIAKLWHKKPEFVFTELVEAKKDRTGSAFMPKAGSW